MHAVPRSILPASRGVYLACAKHQGATCNVVAWSNGHLEIECAACESIVFRVEIGRDKARVLMDTQDPPRVERGWNDG